MTLSIPLKPVLLAATLSIGLTACDSAGEMLDAASGGLQQGGTDINIADGPDVCFTAALEKLGGDAKVAEITSFFSAGEAVDSDDTEPGGDLTVCTVDYQDPNDPRKLLSMQMDRTSGAFGEPVPVEISVSGDASDFNLDDYLITLSDVDTSGLAAKLEEQKEALDGAYSTHAWTSVRLTEPGTFSDVHLIRVDVEGRIKSNDIKESGYIEYSIDGGSIVDNELLP